MIFNDGGVVIVVNIVFVGLMGFIGGVLVIFGVVVCFIIFGDIVFRSVRLIIVDVMNYN